MSVSSIPFSHRRVVFLGRLCSALTELSPHLQQAVLITEKKDPKAEQIR